MRGILMLRDTVEPITASSQIDTIFSFGYVSLTIAGVRCDDSGVYTRRATNHTGEAATQAQREVKAA